MSRSSRGVDSCISGLDRNHCLVPSSQQTFYPGSTSSSPFLATLSGDSVVTSFYYFFISKFSEHPPDISSDQDSRDESRDISSK